MANAEVETVDFELEEDDDLMDEDGAADASPRAPPFHKLGSAVTGAAPSLLDAGLKRTKGRGFKQDSDHNTRLAGSDFDSLKSAGGPALQLQRSIEGWIILVTGIHEEAQVDDIQNLFGEFGEIKNLHLNLDRHTGFIKGYALIEYKNFEEAEEAISVMDGAELLTQIINADWAFSHVPFRRKNTRPARERRSRSPRLIY